MIPRWAVRIALLVVMTSPIVSYGVRAPAPRCTEGTWTIDGPKTIGPLDIHTITITAGVPSVSENCRAQRWASLRGGELRVLFACRDPELVRGRYPLRLRAVLSDACAHMKGAFAIRRIAAIARFTATKTGAACTSNDECTPEAFCQHPIGECAAEGRCAVRPWSCFGVYKPSCGCDGRNHFLCEAAQAGISFADVDPCPCGGVAGRTCAEGELCELPPGTCGAADVEGQCLPTRAGSCPEHHFPVCGCDGVTYANECFRQAARAQKAHDGACKSRCGGVAGVPCPDGQFCDLPQGQCGGADLEGQCVPTNGACPEFYSPVCGCDGVTYVNDCFRQAAGAQKASDGACECLPVCCPPGSTAVDADHDGCTDTCTATTVPCVFIDGRLFCPGLCETACDCYRQLGTDFCDDCPLLCPSCGDFWQCKDGRCVEQCGVLPPDVYTCTQDICGGISELACPPGKVCQFSIFGGCEADAVGQCVPITSCTQQYDPVCGCDGKTYGNDCERSNAGVQRAHYGAC